MPNGISAYHLYLNKQLRLIGLNPFPPSQTFHTQLSSGNGDEDDGEDVDGDEVEDNDEYGDEDDDEDGDGDDGDDAVFSPETPFNHRKRYWTVKRY